MRRAVIAVVLLMAAFGAAAAVAAGGDDLEGLGRSLGAAREAEGSLTGAAGLMGESEQMLRAGSVGPDLRSVQERILAALDAMIEREAAAGGGQMLPGARAARTTPVAVSGTATGAPVKPAEESRPPTGLWQPEGMAPAGVLPGGWAPEMPPAERRKVADAFRTGRLPARYAELLDAYNRRLAREAAPEE